MGLEKKSPNHSQSLNLMTLPNSDHCFFFYFIVLFLFNSFHINSFFRSSPKFDGSSTENPILLFVNCVFFFVYNVFFRNNSSLNTNVSPNSLASANAASGRNYTANPNLLFVICPYIYIYIFFFRNNSNLIENVSANSSASTGVGIVDLNPNANDNINSTFVVLL